MAVAYYPQFDVLRIDANGDRIALPALTIDAYNVTGAASLGTLDTDADSIIVKGSFTADIGDVVEFSHATYPGTFRLTLADTQDGAYVHQDNYIVTFVVENLAATTNSSQGEIYATDLDNPNVRPWLIGTGSAGTTVEIPFPQEFIDRNLRLYCLSIDDNLRRVSTTLDPYNFSDVTIPAGGGGSGYATIQEEGSDLTARAKMNFIGGGVTAADDAGNTRTNITLDATLNALAALTIAANSLSIGTGVDAFNQITFGANTFPARASTGSLIAKTISDDALAFLAAANDAAMRTELGLGAFATQGDGDKNDITVSSSGTVWTIDPAAVTFAKLQNITSDRLLGRDTAGTGSPEELRAQGGIEFTGSAIETSAFTGHVTKTLGGTVLSLGSFTKAELDAAVSDANVLYVGDVTQYTDELAQDAVGLMIDATLEYVDATPLLRRAALTGHVAAPAGSNSTTIQNSVLTEAMQTLSDVTTFNVSSIRHGYAPKSPVDATKFLNGAATPDYAAVKDSDLSLTDIVTNDASTLRHGFLDKLPGGTTTFKRADGAWATPVAAAGDFDNVLTTTSTIAALKTRTIGHRLTINDGGGKLIIQDTGKLVLV
jgi:hypothetical protein